MGYALGRSPVARSELPFAECRFHSLGRSPAARSELPFSECRFHSLGRSPAARSELRLLQGSVAQLLASESTEAAVKASLLTDHALRACDCTAHRSKCGGAQSTARFR